MAKVQQETLQRLARELYTHQLIKFGTFTLKSGIESPFYIDLRVAQSYPSTLQAVADTFAEMLADVDTSIALAGVPEAGTPLATATGFQTKRKLLQPRKVIKDHGTKSSIEGAYQEGDRVVVIDDLITKGDSKLEAIEQITKAGLVLEKFIVLIDREQGGLDAIRKAGHTIEAAMTITALLEILVDDGSITAEQHESMLDFVRNN
ncbi:orotate phosphoribosyltransferase [Candidatus Saccharibacteria bacterium]|nr:orotate phosphoribosyltransferase [Candidatus Saccharibacteria bacterium]